MPSTNHSVLAVLTAGVIGLSMPSPANPADASSARSAVVDSYAKLPLHFEAAGPIPDVPTVFTARGQGYGVYLSAHEAILALGKDAPSLLRMRLIGADDAATLGGENPLSGKVNYFHGNDPAKWRSSLPLYEMVRASKVYPGIDLLYYGRDRRLEYDFVLAPGADPGKIQLRIEGASVIAVDERSGDLVLTLAGREVRFNKPLIYQPAGPDAPRRDIDGRFVARDSRVAFEVGSYDRSRPLVIDPVVVYSTFLGGSNYDAINGIALDSAGNLYIVGTTFSADFPATTGAYKTSCGSDGTCNSGAPTDFYDAFVAKLNPAGSALVYATYLGGNSIDYGNAIAVDSSGSAYVAGGTSSPDFPITAGVAQPICAPHYVYDMNCNPSLVSAGCSFGAYSNGFVTKLNPAGSALVYSTYIGGKGSDSAVGLALDSAGEAHVLGFATSHLGSMLCPSGSVPTDLPWPITANAYTDPSHVQGNQYMAVTKLNAAGSAFLYSTAFGEKINGSSTTNFAGAAIAVGNDGRIYTTGILSENSAITPSLPTTSGAFQTSPPFSCTHTECSFVAAFDPSQSGAASLSYSTYLGGSAAAGEFGDKATGIAVDSSDNAYVTGFTQSADFPTTAGAFQAVNPHEATNPGVSSGFVTKFNPTGTALVYSTYVSGTGGGGTFPASVVVDSSGSAYIGGITSDADYPLSKSVQASLDNASTAFASELNGSGSSLLFSTYWGPGGTQAGGYVAADGAGGIYLAGTINNSSSSYQTTAGALETMPPGNYDGFIAKFANPVAPPPLTLGALALPEGEVCTAATACPPKYSAPLVTGGQPPYTLKRKKGSIPAGLTFSPQDGTLSGLPTQAVKKHDFTVEISDQAKASVTGTFTISIAPLLSPVPRAYSGRVGKPFSETVRVRDGVPPYSCSAPFGLPPGLEIDPTTCTISGTPTAATPIPPGNSYGIRVQDSLGAVVTIESVIDIP